MAERVGINSSDLECLDIIVLRGTVTAGELAAATGLTTAAITDVIDRLEQAGLRGAVVMLKIDARCWSGRSRRSSAGSRRSTLSGRSMSALWSGYSAQELALLIEFLVSSHAICCEETARLRAATAAPGRGSRPAASER